MYGFYCAKVLGLDLLARNPSCYAVAPLPDLSRCWEQIASRRRFRRCVAESISALCMVLACRQKPHLQQPRLAVSSRAADGREEPLALSRSYIVPRSGAVALPV